MRYLYPTYPAIQLILSHLFPDAQARLQILGSGQQSVGWLATIGNEQFVVRASPTEKGNRERYLREFAVLVLLFARDCPVPEPIATNADSSHAIPEIIFDWSITRHTVGRPIGQKALSEANAIAIGEIFAHLHHISTEGYGNIQVTDTGFRGMASDRRTGAMQKWQDYQLWGLHDGVPIESTIIGNKFRRYIEPLKSYLPYIQQAIESGDSVLCHVDLHNGHIYLHRDGTLSGIIDFGEVCLLPAAWDFAIAARYFGWRAVDDMLIGYTTDQSERASLREQAYLLGLVFGVFRLQRQFVRNAGIIYRARTLQFIVHTLNRLNQRS